MNGILIIDKPEGFTSFDVVAVARGCLHERRVGHTGTLDPMATGVLPVLVGSATKAQPLLPDTDKEYEAGFRLGLTTDTLDSSGRVLSKSDIWASRDDILALMPGFRGKIMQKPPMYSAVSKNGVRLYELARRGVEIEREERQVEISLFELTEFNEQTQQGRFRICCSKGTYIRVICDDIGRKLGCGCIMSSLRRTAACGYRLNDAVTVERLRELAAENRAQELVKPVDSIFSMLGSVSISEKQAFRFNNGGALMLSRLRLHEKPEQGELLRVYDNEGVFLGLGIADREKEEMAVKKRF